MSNYLEGASNRYIGILTIYYTNIAYYVSHYSASPEQLDGTLWIAFWLHKLLHTRGFYECQKI